jgi:5-methylthioadenosine/S-adenosylhomocysteine deaminase
VKLRPARFGARWLLPVSTPPLRDGAVLVDAEGRIAAVGPLESVPLPEGAESHDLGEAVLLPGLINAHTHLDISVFRGLLEDLPFPSWIATLLRGQRETPLDADDTRAAARWSCLEALAAGITTLGTTEAGDGALYALRESGQRGILFREVFGPAPGQAADAVSALCRQVEAMQDLETDLVRVGLSPHAPYTVSDALFSATADAARALGRPVAVHIAESAAEHDLVTRGSGVFAERLRARGIATAARARSPIALLERTGILALSPLLVHCVHADAEDIAMLAAAGARVAHCPAANARLGHGIAPVVALQAAGVCVALGTDSVASNNRMDVLDEARLAQLLQRGRTLSADALPAATLLRMATLDGARALGLDARVGSLEPRKDADLCAVRLTGVHVRPVHDPLAALFHAARAPDVALTVVRGRVLYRDGRALTIDADPLRSQIEMIAARLRRTLPAPP